MNQIKDINQRGLLKLVEVSLKEGISKKDLCQELTDSITSSHLDANAIPKTIAYFPDSDLKIKYKKQNTVLVALLMITAVFKVLVAIPALFELQAIGILLMVFLPFLNIWLALEVMKTRAYVYRVIGVLAVAGIINSLLSLDTSSVWFMMDLVFMGVIAFLGFVLSKKLFPNYRYSGPVKDEKGDWLM